MQVEFVIHVIPIPRDNQLSYEKVMAPQTLTAYSMVKGRPGEIFYGNCFTGCSLCFGPIPGVFLGAEQ